MTGKLLSIAVLTGGMLTVNAIAAAAIKAEQKSYAGIKLIPQDGFTVTAHAGSLNTVPNSLHSLVAAAEAGADILELDVNKNGNGLPVLSHDKPSGGEPSLAEALRMLSTFDGIRLNLDIKDSSVLSEVQKLCEEYGFTERAFLTGIFPDDVVAVKENSPLLKYYLNYNIVPSFGDSSVYHKELAGIVKNYGALGLNIYYRSASASLADELHKNGLKLSVWTVNKQSDIKRCLAIKADNITSKHPDRVIKAIKEG